MKNSNSLDLIDERDELQRNIILQREKIAQQLFFNPEDGEGRFPRSNTMRFLYSAKGLIAAQMLFKMFTRNNPGSLTFVKTFGKFLLKR
jgi:hypothetical protein